MSVYPATPEADRLVDQLTLEEQISLMAGKDFWNVGSIDRLEIGCLRVTDGPNGARGSHFVGGARSAAFPVGIAIGATWNPELIEKIGAALALETRDKGASTLLAPTINIQRGPLNGRNFECYSEDPILTAELAIAYVRGLQANGVAATLKHFAANESEIRRTVNSSDVDERTLRELYLVPFERAIKEAGSWAIMSSYNKINGTYAADNQWLLTKVLREDWGFEGLSMSDWFGLRSTVEGANSGLSLEMPGPAISRGEKLLKAVQDGLVPAELIRAAALNVLRLLERTGDLHNMAERVEVENERDSTRAIIREAGIQSAVLLKNEGGVLPVASDATIAMVGPNANAPRSMGGGSAQLNAYRQVSAFAGMVEALGENRVSFAQGVTNTRFQPNLNGTFTREWFANDTLSGDPVLVDTLEHFQYFFMDAPEGIDPTNHSCRVRGAFKADKAGTWRFGMNCTGKGRLFLNGEEVIEAWDSWVRGSTFFEEGCDPIEHDIALHEGEEVEVVFEFATKPTFDLHFHAYQVGVDRVLGEKEIAEAVELAAAADVAVVCVGRSAEWDTEGWDLPNMTLPGNQNALVEAVAAKAKKTVVLLQTGGPVEMPWLDQVDAVLQCWYAGQEAGHAIADVITGARTPGGKLPQSFPVTLEDAPTFNGTDDGVYPGLNGRVEYREKLEIGYRHHAKTGIKPLFPFGFGLSYTRFELGTPEVTVGADGVGTVRVTVTNTGDREGSEVVQLYVAPKAAPVDRPIAELKAFKKVILAAGASAVAEMALKPRDFAYFDVEGQKWVVAEGDYELWIGTSAEDIAARTTVQIAAQKLAV